MVNCRWQRVRPSTSHLYRVAYIRSEDSDTPLHPVGSHHHLQKNRNNMYVNPTYRCTHFALLLRKTPPVMVTTVGVPHATTAPPSSSARLLLNVPPSIVTREPPIPRLFPEQYTFEHIG